MSELAPSGIAALFNDVNNTKLPQTVALIDRLPRRGASRPSTTGAGSTAPTA